MVRIQYSSELIGLDSTREVLQAAWLAVSKNSAANVTNIISQFCVFIFSPQDSHPPRRPYQYSKADLIMLYTPSHGQTTQVFDDYAIPFQYGGLRRVVADDGIQTAVGMGGIDCCLVLSDIEWIGFEVIDG